MKLITSNLAKFALLLTISTVALRFGLSSMLENRHFTLVWVVVALYAIAVFAFGWIFGKRDNETLPLYDIGLRFHVVTYIICNAIAELWYLAGLQSQYEHIRSVHLTVLFWGLGLLLHFILYLFTRKHAINGLKKTEIFE